MTAKKHETATPDLPDTLADFTLGLVNDLKALRAGKITNADARVRAQLAREVLRAAHLHIEGLKVIAGQARALPGPEGGDAGAGG